MKYYTVYKITNIDSNKVYIGAHKTDDLNDDYMGSGNMIKRAINKHGIDKFKKEYIAIFDNPEQMYNLERELVTEDFIKRDDTYNMRVGGSGGWDFCNTNNKRVDISEQFKRNPLIKDKSLSNAMKRLSELRLDETWKSKVSRKQSLAAKGNQRFLGKTHTDETKKRMSLSHKGKQDGEKNSQFGTRWICNIELKQNKKISKDDEIPNGWLLGRNLWNK
jgi:hypothetical protein